MTPTASSTLINNSMAAGQWQKDVRGGIRLQVQWWPQEGGRTVLLRLQQLQGPGMAMVYNASLGLAAGESKEGRWEFGAPGPVVELNLLLQALPPAPGATHADISLVANVPLAVNEFFNAPIGHWHAAANPDAPPRPVPDLPGQVDDQPLGTELFTSHWLQPLSPAEQSDIVLLTMAPVDASSLPFYETLAAVTGDTPVAIGQGRRAAATTFLDGGLPNLTSTSQLTAPTSTFADWHSELLSWSGLISLEHQLEQVNSHLQSASQDSVQDLSDYLALSTTTTDTNNLWQTMFALALRGTAAQADLSTAWVNCLRVLHYLTELQSELASRPAHAEDAPLAPLVPEAKRRQTLQATPCLPDVCTAWPLSGESSQGNAWQLLGVGQVALAHQQALGYALGELAEVVNVLPREHLQHMEHSGQSQLHQNQQGTQQQRQNSTHQHADASSALADALKTRFHSQGDLNDLSNLQQSYDNLNLTLTGNTGQANAQLDNLANQQHRSLQRSGEQAAQGLSLGVQAQRHAVWQEWREQQSSRSVDNSEGQRLVGVYRWVDRLVGLSWRPQGPRMLLAFQIQQPAQAWLDQLAAQGPVPLIKPCSLADLSPPVTVYTDILPSNYQAYGAVYGLDDLAPPPPDQLTISLQVQRSSAGEHMLQVPPGYAAASGKAALALGDSNYNVVACVADQPLSTSSACTAPSELSLAVPQVTTTSTPSVGPLTIDRPAPPATTLAAPLSLSFSPPVTGAVPVTVLTESPQFVLTVSLCCQRIGLETTDGSTPPDILMQRWQLQIFQRLQQAWEAQSRQYDAELATRIALASDGCEEAIQRQSLQAACLDTLVQASELSIPPADASTPAPSATSQAAGLAGGLDWIAMSWHYEAWVGTPERAFSQGPESGIDRQRLAAQPLFGRFLRATTARVLVPVRPTQQAALLYALQWQAAWPTPMPPQAGSDRAVPISQSALPYVIEQHRAPMPATLPPSILRLPTPQMYLQASDELPRWRAAEAGAVRP